MNRLDELSLADLPARLYGDDRPLALGIGATTSIAYARSKARRMFLDELHRLDPNAMTALVADEALDLIIRYRSLSDSSQPRQPEIRDVNAVTPAAAGAHRVFEPDSGSPGLEELHTVGEQVEAHIATWQRRFHLSDTWAADAARATLWVAAEVWHTGKDYRGPFVLAPEDLTASPHGRTQSSHLVKPIPVTLDSLKILDLEFGDGGLLGYFDPRLDTIENAMSRIMAGLEKRLLALLQLHVIGDAYTEGAIITPGERRKAAAFEWLVRYQVMGESRKQIALADKIDRGHISKEVTLTAQLVGLTLRPAKPGRPRRKPNARTKRVG